ncbi:MAG: hypothetical protein V1870_03725 [Candidatus Aenigmatarchaeota archaeon]
MFTILLYANGDSVKNAIIKILSAHYPLNIKTLSEMIKKSDNKTITYPAIYNALKTLEKEEKIIKTKNGFMLSIKWLQELKKFSEKTEQNYAKTPGLISIGAITNNNETKTFTFNNLDEAEKYRKTLQIEYISEKRIHPYCAIYNHLKSPVTHSETALNIISAIARQKIQSYFAVAANTPIDRWCANFYMRSPWTFVKTGLKIPYIEVCETMVLGNIIIQTYIPKHIQDYLNSIYQKTKKLEDMNTLEFYNRIYKTPAKTDIVVIKNPEIADYMRKQILGYFRKDDDIGKNVYSEAND